MFSSYQQRFVPGYKEDFVPKVIQRDGCIRTGSSSGQRRNNPHPSDAFMVWRYPKTFMPPYSIDRESSPIPTIHLACSKSKTASTYQADYLRPASRLIHMSNSPSIQHNGQSSPMSTQTWSFQVPKCSKRLRGNTTRYGCNEDKNRPACGGVPTISLKECQHHGLPTTSYVTHYHTPDSLQMNSSVPKLPHLCQKKNLLEANSSKPSWLSQWTGPA